MRERQKSSRYGSAGPLLAGFYATSRTAACCGPRLLPVLLLSFFTLNLRGQETTTHVMPHDHPNHYIILIDASGSARKQNKKAAFLRAVGEVLPRKLYQSGFGESIPPIDPERDLMSLHHFGIVTGVSGPAYEHLDEFNLLTQFVHSVFVRRERMGPDSLQSQVFPTQTYNLTFLAWSKQMALWSSRALHPTGRAERTFLITVHDGKFNEADLREELRTLTRWADRSNYEEAKQVVDDINVRYRFVGGDSAERQEKVFAEGSDEPIFVEAYQVVSVAQSAYEGRLEETRPFDDLQFAWERGSGDAATGVLKGRINGGFAELLRSAGGSSGSLVVMGQTNPKTDFAQLAPGVETRVVLPEPPSCQQNQSTAVLNLDLPMTDAVLGARTVKYSYQQPFDTPPTFSCTSSFYRLIALGVLAVVLVGLIVWYCVKYRLRTTHLKISMPGLVIPLRLRRRGVARARARIAPRATLEAFTLHLPHMWVQKIFYRGAKLLLENTNVYWNATSSTELALPLERRKVKAFWRVVPEERTVTTLSFEQGGQCGVVNLSHASKEVQPEDSHAMDSLRVS